MGENYGYSPEEETRLHEFGRLSDAMAEAERKIDEGTDTSAAQLDRYLAAAAAFYKWQTHNPHPDRRDEGESNAQWYWRYQNILNGSYQKEKADFALETALEYKARTDKRDKHLQDEDTRKEVREAFTAQNGESRKVAANWFAVTANCLSMPTERPQAPGQQEPSS